MALQEFLANIVNSTLYSARYYITMAIIHSYEEVRTIFVTSLHGFHIYSLCNISYTLLQKFWHVIFTTVATSRQIVTTRHSPKATQMEDMVIYTLPNGLTLYRLYSKGHLLLERAWQVLSIIFTTSLHYSPFHDLLASNMECMLGVYAYVSTFMYKVVILGCNRIIAKTNPASYASISPCQAVVCADGGFVSLEIISTNDSSYVYIYKGEMDQADPYCYKMELSLLWALLSKHSRQHSHILLHSKRNCGSCILESSSFTSSRTRII